MTNTTVRAEDGPSEESPLLASAGGAEFQAKGRSRSSLRTNVLGGLLKIHPAYLVIPVLFASYFGATITTTPTIEIFRQIICRWWFSVYDPDGLPSDGSEPSDEQCSIPGVEKIFSIIVTVSSVIDAVGGMITAGFISHFATRYGRKPVLFVMTVLTAISTVCFLAAAKVTSSPLQEVLLLCWVIIAAFSGIPALVLVCNMYIVDTTEPTERTFALSVAGGFGALGTAPTYWLGGYISRRFSSVTLVFRLKLILTLITLAYILVLPESFSAENREATRREAASKSIAEPSRAHSKTVLLLRRPWDAIKSILGPLSYLKPTHNFTTGRVNFRLLVITCSQVMSSLGMDFIGQAFIIYTTVRFHFKPDQMGTSLSAFAFSNVIWLSICLPAILRWVRPFYSKQWAPKHTRARPSIGNDFGADATVSVSSHADADMASHFDVYIAIASSFVWAISISCIALAPSSGTVIAALMSAALGTGHNPSIKSMTVASVDPLHSAQVLSALAIATSLSALFTPLVMGWILSATIATIPQLVFFICAASVTVGGLILFLVRDSDRYMKPVEDEE